MGYNVLILDPAQWKVTFDGPNYRSTVRQFVTDWGQSLQCDLCYNLGMFNMPNSKTGASITYVHTARGDLSYGGYSDDLRIDGFNTCKGYANGIVNNKIVKKRWLRETKTFRNGIGMTDSGKIIIAQTLAGTKVTQATFCSVVLSRVKARGESVKLFVLQDGGGSTSHYSNLSKLGYYPAGKRRVSTVVCINRRNVPKVTRTLKYLCKGEDVRTLQIVLGGLECDGYFGNGTLARLKAAQKALGLKVTGVADLNTLRALGIA